MKKNIQWHEYTNRAFTKADREHTTILMGGLTLAQDTLIEAGLQSLGYKIKALDVPDNQALRIGKEYGNKAQCNPTYFTVGNLIKYLVNLRDEKGLSTEEIIKKYVFLTAGACGPCRFGMYLTEYRKALRESGFEGFRILKFDQNPASFIKNTSDNGLELSPKFLFKLLQAFYIGDILNLIGYRIRPYEVVKGQTDKALELARKNIANAFINKTSINKACIEARKSFLKIKTNYKQAKPKVSVIGEFWAMTTEGDGNYQLNRFLEKEGAECDIQPIVNWIAYILWQKRVEAENNMMLPKQSVKSKYAFSPVLIKYGITGLNYLFNGLFYYYARKLGLKNYKIADMKSIMDASKEHYHQEAKGGEGPMEVGKLILSSKHNKANLVISVKPFGCMPSSGISDGIQSLVVQKYPNVQFLAIETSGDGAANFYSRVQMALFQAKEKANLEFANAQNQPSKSSWYKTIKESWFGSRNKIRYPKHIVACTGANYLLSR